MNPYAKYLGNRDARQTIAETAGRLEAVLSKHDAAAVEKNPAPGKWSIRQILCHLADCELVFAVRLRQALAEPHHVIQPFDQDTWAERYGQQYTAQAALELFRAARNWNLMLLKTATAEDLGKTLTHPERGQMTFQIVVETMAGHDLNHLAQLEKL